MRPLASPPTGEPAPPLRVALAAPAPLVLAGLRAAFDRQPDFAVVATAASLAALARSGQVAVDVIVAAAAALRGSRAGARAGVGGAFAAPRPDTTPPLVVLAELEARELGAWLRRGYGALQSGAGAAELQAAARCAAAGLQPVAPAILAALLPAPVGAAGAAAHLEPLTAREREVLAQMAAGLGNRAIARTLAISEHTAKFHVAQVMGKLQAASRTEAVVRGARAGLLHLEPAEA